MTAPTPTAQPPLSVAGSSLSASSRRPSGALSSSSSPRPPEIPRSSSVSVSIDFFESKSRSSTPSIPAAITVPHPQQPRKDETGTGAGTSTGMSVPSSPKPAGPRTMSPPSREGRRLSYRPSSDFDGAGVRRSLEDPRRGLGLGIQDVEGGIRRASESGASMGISAGPSRIRSRSARAVNQDGDKGPEKSISPAAAGPETSRRPVLRPRQPSSQAQKPAIRVVQPTPSSSARRRTSAPPESPSTPTHARALSPAGASSSSSAGVSTSSRSIRPGSRRTSYQLANSSDASDNRSSIISEFGVLGATRQSPRLGRFIESFDDTDLAVASDSKGKSPEIPENTGTPLLDTSPFVIQRANGTHIGGGDLDAFSDSSSFATSAASSSYVSAKSPSSPPTRTRPHIPTRTSSSAASPPAVSRRTSSIDGLSPRSPSSRTKGFDLGPVLRATSRGSNSSDRSAESGETKVRRASEATTKPRQSVDLDHPPPAVFASSSDPVTPPLGIPTSPNPPSSVSPRPTRKSPGLTINPPPPRPPRDTARPSPPIPAKSPLRRLTPQHPSLPDLREGRSPRMRDGSGESALATGSSMTESFETAPLAPESDEMVLEPGESVPYPASYDSGHTHEEIRFTMLTVPSVYSQDSAPSTARTMPDSEFGSGSGGPTTGGSGSFGWGRQRHSITSLGSAGGWEDAINRSASLPRLRISSSDTGKSLPETPRETPSTAHTSSSASRDVDDGHSPLTPSRSPSMPVLNGAHDTPRQSAAAKVPAVVIVTPNVAKQRSPAPAQVPSGMTRSQTTPMPLGSLLSGSNGGGKAAASGHGRTVSIPTSPVTNASKRSHLVREIVTTERSYANDLALVRDAYLMRYIRPGSQVSTVDSTAAPSETSRRSSIYTYQTAETKRSSGHDLGLLVPQQKSPAYELGAGGNSYMTASASNSSLAGLAHTHGHGQAGSSRTASGSSLAGSMAPPIGKPLSPADVRTVFLNLDQLAAAAEEMATAFEGAMGSDASPAVGREGEAGNDRLGEVFVSFVQRFRSIYNFYCARQSTASSRLRELLADPAHATSLNDCWSHVKPHTHAWDLDSMLIKPVQRITKYPLLFDDLLACTTPVHADYFNIRNSALLARSVAQEIDETKRRKDVVAGVISKNGSKMLGSGDRSKSNIGGGGGGLKLFRKEKSTSAVPTTSSSSTALAHQASMSTLDLGSVAEITKASLTHFKDLVNRVDQCEQCVRRAGKEIILWTAAAKDVFMIQDGLVKAWLGLVTLDGQEGPDPKLVWFRKVIAGIVSDAWRALNDEVQDQVVPALSKLLESGINPRKVIAKRDLKAPDYARYFSMVEAKKPVDRTILQSAKDFVALHTQLVEELPLFLEGYMRIFDLAMCAFAQAQASYHYRVRERMGEYVAQYLDGIKRSPAIKQSSPRLTTDRRQEQEIDNRSIAGIVRNWSDAWSPYADAVDRFQCTKPARQAATRIASFQDRPGSHVKTHTRQNSSQSRIDSRSNSPLPPVSPSRPTAPTFRPDRGADHQRKRSTSLMGPPPLPSPSKEKTGFFGLSRSSKSPNTNNAISSSMSKSATSPMKEIPRLRSPSPLDPSVRNSFGLPTISPDSGRFSGLGALGRSSSQRSHSRNGSTSSLVSNPGLGFGFTFTAPPGGNGGGMGEVLRRGDSQSQSRSRKSSTSSRSDRRRKTQSMVSTLDVMSPHVVSKPEQVDAAGGWKGEKVLYQCACVAAFSPDQFGRKRYRGLEFLSMTVGDLFDVLHEVGRIDELPSFPYPEIGVDNDGVLVAQGESGEIGLVICSFLEPLT